MIDTIPLSDIKLIPPESPTAERRHLLTHIGGDDYLLVMDNTAAEKIVRCETAGRFYLAFEREAHAKNAALTFGGAIHEGLEGFYIGQTDEQQNSRIVQYFTDNPSPPDEYRTPSIALEVMKHYRQQCLLREDYKDETLRDSNGKLLIEVPFEVPLGVLVINQEIQLPVWDAPRFVREIHVAWSGRIDRPVSMNGVNRIQDHKTTSMGGDQYLQSFQLSNQTIGYLWAGRQMWPEFNLLGFNLNAIHLKKPTGKVGLMERGPRGGEPALSFFRANFDYTAERVNQWPVNMLTLIEDWVHCFVRDYFPMRINHCFNKYGRCPYFDVCTVDNPETRVRFLQSDAFKDVTWDPTVGR